MINYLYIKGLKLYSRINNDERKNGGNTKNEGFQKSSQR
jgi:hypothetical protein